MRTVFKILHACFSETMRRLVSRDRAPSAGRRHADRHIRHYPDTRGHYSFAPGNNDSNACYIDLNKITQIETMPLVFDFRETSCWPKS